MAVTADNTPEYESMALDDTDQGDPSDSAATLHGCPAACECGLHLEGPRALA